MLLETLAPFRTSWDRWDISAHFELHRHHPYLWLWFALYFPANGHLTLAWCCSLPASFWQPPLLSSSALPAIASHILSTVLHILEAGPFVHYLSDIMVKLWNQVYNSITGFSLLFSFFFFFIKNKSTENTDCLHGCDAIFFKEMQFFHGVSIFVDFKSTQFYWLQCSYIILCKKKKDLSQPGYKEQIFIRVLIILLSQVTATFFSNQVPKKCLFLKNKSSLRDTGIHQLQNTSKLLHKDPDLLNLFSFSGMFSNIMYQRFWYSQGIVFYFLSLVSFLKKMLFTI